ncbi:sensor histidine kinase [Aquimarina algicola]|uniref:Signal transduction histidine kinase internal region domain-containing protein n=1 Tax=Aquimarina algicola TaxID=2589995 RepID=A0A504J5W8_9FLAO|nr:histidine kinase [Aquimarina algicola]TPN83975.1 hypothetical protein FHK87_18605 [Aquimarina algicola]
MNSSKINRIYFYLIISVLVNLLNFLKEIEDESVSEAVYETLVLFPVIFLLCFATFFVRKYFIGFKKLMYAISYSKFTRIVFWSSVISIQTIVLSLITRAITQFLFNDDPDPVFFDLIFWAIIIATFFITLFVYFLEHFFESQREKQNIELTLFQYEKEKTIAKYLALKKQLNPHFLFNSFNSLMGLIAIDSKKAEYFLRELSNVYRYNLTQNEEMVVPLQKEIEMIQSYFYLQKIRFGDHLILKNEIENDKMNMLLPPMTIELLVSNAIKHNVIEKSKPLTVTISTKDDLVLVKNNYQPKDIKKYRSNSLGIGLKNLSDQLELIHHKKPYFKIIDNTYIAGIPLIHPEI